MPYLALLIENLHYYVDDFLEYVMEALSNGLTLYNMELDLFVKEQEWMKHFDKKKEPIVIHDLLHSVKNLNSNLNCLFPRRMGSVRIVHLNRKSSFFIKDKSYAKTIPLLGYKPKSVLFFSALFLSIGKTDYLHIKFLV